MIPTAQTTPLRPAAGGRALTVLQGTMPDAVLRSEIEFGEVTIWVSADRLVEVATLLRDHTDARYSLALYVTAVDYPDREPAEPRFDVVYQLRSLTHNDTCKIIVQVPAAAPQVPSLERLFATLDWHERETYDLLGIVFEGHHDLQRILLPVDWEGHPLRKDYVSFGEPVAFTHNLEWALPAAERPDGMPGGSR